MAVWQGILTGWHWVVSVLGSIVLWCVLAAVVLVIVERVIYRRKKRRGQS